MSGVGQSFENKHLTQTARERFTACLVISSLSFMLFGFNLAQTIRYFSKFWRRDRNLIKLWVLMATASNAASVLYGGVYADWILSISSWSSSFVDQNNIANGVSSFLYAVTVTLVQSFFCGCIFVMLSSRPTLRWFCCSLIILVTLASFSVAASLGIILIHQSSGGISDAQSRLGRAIDSLTLLADFLILLTIAANLIMIKTRSKRLKRRISKLSWIFFSVTIFSSFILVAEIVLIYPTATQSRYIIDFTYFYSPIYFFSMLSILNARTLYITERETSSSEEIEERTAVRMDFTIDFDFEGTTVVRTEEEPEIPMDIFKQEAPEPKPPDSRLGTRSTEQIREGESESTGGNALWLDRLGEAIDPDPDPDAIELA